jgi:C4-dicarboxylate transporter DctQ subunit
MLSRIINRFEESVIALLLAGMTLVTFSQVVARYLFNSGAVWALELTTYLFAWLVLFGMSYGVKVGAHLGVDAFVKLFSKRSQRIFTLIAALCCIAYAVILLVGAWEYVGKVYRIGIEAEDLPIPRWIPYSMLPIGLALLLLRFLEATYLILIGKRETLSASHEVEDAVKEARETALHDASKT